MNAHMQTVVQVNGQVVRTTSVETRSVTASLELINVHQQGSHILGTLRAKLDAGFASITVDKTFDIPTGLENPYYVDLGTISVPFIGDLAVAGSVAYDLPGRTVTFELLIEGIPVAHKTVNF
jgi:hypothetical protein